ncbi:hypothetical protein DSECCO2_336350 [anaerobic digester metagenome]
MAFNIVIREREGVISTFIIHFTDDKGNEVSKEKASTAVINEYIGEKLVTSSIGLLS